jgi:hypothetical protein
MLIYILRTINNENNDCSIHILSEGNIYVPMKDVEFGCVQFVSF